MNPPPLTGPVLRIGAALLLCAACFQVGRWYQELSAPAAVRAAAKADPGNEMVSATFRGEPEPASKTVEPAPLVGVGAPVGQSADLITPLNVRDPSALVMGPGPSAQCVPAAVSEPRVPAAMPVPRAKPLKPLKSGRLLELLREADKKTGAPKSF